MKFTKTGTYGDTTEILANDHYVAITKALNFAGNSTWQSSYNNI